MPEDGYDSVSVPTDDYEQAKEYKPEDVTWGDCLVAGADRLNDTQGTDMAHRVGGDGVNTDELAEQLAVALGDDYTAVAGAPQADGSEIASAVVRQFDYAELANRVADELEGRMR